MVWCDCRFLYKPSQQGLSGPFEDLKVNAARTTGRRDSPPITWAPIGRQMVTVTLVDSCYMDLRQKFLIHWDNKLAELLKSQSRRLIFWYFACPGPTETKFTNKLNYYLGWNSAYFARIYWLFLILDHELFTQVVHLDGRWIEPPLITCRNIDTINSHLRKPNAYN